MLFSLNRIYSNLLFIFLILSVFLGNGIFVYSSALILLLYSLLYFSKKIPNLLLYFLFPIFPIEIIRLVYYRHFDLDFINLCLILVLCILSAKNYVITKFQVISSITILISSFFVFDLIQEAIPYSNNHFIRIILPALLILNFRFKRRYLELGSLIYLFYFSYLSSSRSAMFISFVLILLYVLYHFVGNLSLSFFLLMGIMYFLYLNLDVVLELFLNDSLNPELALKLSNEGTGSYGRESILEFVLNNLNIENIFFGFESHFVFRNFGFESHNSYLELFTYYGLFILILFIIITLYMSWKVYLSADYIMFIFFIFIILRSYFDNFLFINNFDFTFWLFVLYFNRTRNFKFNTELT
jgi:hypothetical protein